MRPSPFVTDLMALLPESLLTPDTASGEAFAIEDAACWRDLRNCASDNVYPSLRKAFDQELAHAESLAAVEKRRNARSGFDKYDGVLSESALVEELAERYGPTHAFSAKQVEAYAECPFRFFVEQVLHVADCETPVAAFDARVRGLILHDVLRRFHTQFVGIPVAEIPEEDAASAMRALVEAAFEQHGHRSVTAPPGLLLVEKQNMLERLLRYLAIERACDEPPWRPARFEVPFGPARANEEGTLRGCEPLVLDTEAGAVQFAGRIDRIDEMEDVARVIDYKTTVHERQKDIKAGKAAQLLLYALAMEQLATPCEEAHYAAVGRSRKKWVEALGRGKRDGWETRVAAVKQSVADAVTGIRAGRFPPVPYDEACKYCPMKGACRYEPGRIERKLEQRP